MTVIQTLSPFVIGGLTVGFSTVLAEKMSTKASSLFWSLPISMFPTLIMLWNKDHNIQEIRNLVFTNIPGMFVLLGFFIGMWFALKKFGFWESMGVGCGIWMLLACVYWIFICPSPVGASCLKLE